MRILQLCNKMPYPPVDGYAIAAYNLSRSFAAAGMDVAVLAMNTTRHPVNEETIPGEIRKKINLRTVKVDNRLDASAALVNLLQNRSYHVSRFISKEFDAALVEMLARFQPQIVQLEGLYLAPYIGTIRAHSSAKIVLRAHNVEHLVWARNSARETNFLKKTYLKILSRQLMKYERSVLQEIDLLVPVSTVDAATLCGMGCTRPVHVCPVSYDEERLPSPAPAIPGSVFFIGTLDWLPNLEGLKWFLEQVWDKARARHPGLSFYLAGRNIPAFMKSDAERNIHVVGEVPDGPWFMRDKQVMVVPLFAGSGMRVKIIEGMSMGRTIVSTSIGAEGIACRDMEHLLIANTGAEFIEALVTCVTDPAFAERLGQSAAAFAKENYSASGTAAALLNFYRQQLL
jgi:glycosyltransferase involved in cell wall biosynthesis